MGKASVSNITVPFGFAVVPKAIAMARYSVVASPLAILPHAPPGSFRWHRTAPQAGIILLNVLPRLAPYCYSLAGTLLLLTGWHRTATR